MTSSYGSYPRWLFPDYDGLRSFEGSSLRPKRDSGGLGEDSQVRIREDDAKFEITLDVQHYKPDELKV